MMSYYGVRTILTVNNEIYGVQYWHEIRDNESLPDGNVETTVFHGWDWLKLAEENKHLPSKDTCTYDRKGIFHKRLYFFGWGMDDYLLGKKFILNPTDNIIIETTWTECPVSLEQILKYHNSEKAIQWLKDRGITTCPLNPQ